jgi:tetratricopeptide (TPR) repeat protein
MAQLTHRDLLALGLLALELLVLGLLALGIGTASAQSPLLAELDAAAKQYHEDPAQLDRLRAAFERAIAADPTPSRWTGLSRICFLWGDIRATTREQKLEAYDRGRKAGQRAVELSPRDASAHFWYATNTGRWGQINGVVRSLFLLSTVREHLNTALQLDPNLTGAYVVLGYVYYEVPGLFGGDLDRAEESFRTALKQVPNFTTARVGLARTLAKKGKAADARREAQAVLDEPAPFSPADWTVKDAPDARALLESLKDKR